MKGICSRISLRTANDSIDEERLVRLRARARLSVGRLALAALLAVMLAASPTMARDATEKNPQAAPQTFPGMSEIALAGSDVFPKWTKLLTRFARQIRDTENGVAPRAMVEAASQWHRLIDALRHRDPRFQIAAVNAFFNRAVAYRTDQRTYGRADYWATPHQLLARRVGDCEDIAAAKYLALRALGFRTDELRLVVGFDRRRRTTHAVALAMLDGRALILDNNVERVIDATRMVAFRPYYSVNETNSWLHRPSG